MEVRTSRYVKSRDLLAQFQRLNYIYVTLVTQDSPIRYCTTHSANRTSPLYRRSLLKLSISAAMIVAVNTN